MMANEARQKKVQTIIHVEEAVAKDGGNLPFRAPGRFWTQKHNI